MDHTSRIDQLSSFRSHRLVWLSLAILLWSFVPTLSMAQQPTAAISVLSGTVLVNGQHAAQGTMLSAGDIIETQTGASVVLELSDGSLIELSENTKLDMTVLSQTATGARTSHVKMWWGRVRAQLSARHQQAGSNFNIETPNALVGVKFSQPDVEVIYNPAEEKTTAFAHTVALWVTNLLTGEQVLVPVGSTVIITALGIQVIAGITATGAIATETTAVGATATGAAVGTAAAGMSTGTMVAIGAGAVAAAGGVVAVVASVGDKNGGDGNGGVGDGGDGDGGIDWNNPFTGTFRNESFGPLESDEACFVPPGSTKRKVTVITLEQNGTVLTGTASDTRTYDPCCAVPTQTTQIRGTVTGLSATISFSGLVYFCAGTGCSCQEDNSGEYTNIPVTLVDNGRIFRIIGDGETDDYYRQ